MTSRRSSEPTRGRDDEIRNPQREGDIDEIGAAGDDGGRDADVDDEGFEDAEQNEEEENEDEDMD